LLKARPKDAIGYLIGAAKFGDIESYRKLGELKANFNPYILPQPFIKHYEPTANRQLQKYNQSRFLALMKIIIGTDRSHLQFSEERAILNKKNQFRFRWRRNCNAIISTWEGLRPPQRYAARRTTASLSQNSKIFLSA
jgi:hypothetical protein